MFSLIICSTSLYRIMEIFYLSPSMVKFETPMGLFLPNLRSSSVKSLGWSSPEESQSSESLPPFGPLPPFLDRSAICLFNSGNHCTANSICKPSVWSSSRTGVVFKNQSFRISHCTFWYFYEKVLINSRPPSRACQSRFLLHIWQERSGTEENQENVEQT